MRFLKWIYHLFFAPKFRTMGEFIAAVKSSDSKLVKIEVQVDVTGGVESAIVGTIGTFAYNLVFSAGRLSFKEQVGARQGSRNGMSDAEERLKVSVSAYLMGEKRLREMEAEFPDFAFKLVDPKGNTMFRKDFESLHNAADKLGLAVLVF